MIYYMDSEFYEDGVTIDLISIALVREDGRSFYAVSKEFNEERCSAWVKRNVIAHLPPKEEWISREEIKEGILSLIAGDLKPEFWAYFADYDWVVFCQLFGTMMDLPKGMPHMCMDLKQLAVSLGIKDSLKNRVPQKGTEHDALADTMWNIDAHKYLIKYQEEGES